MKRAWPELGWSRVVVYGLGESGLAAARLLRRHGVGVVGVDSRPLEELALGSLGNDPGMELAVGHEPRTLPEGTDALVLSPGVPPDRPLIEAARGHGLPVLSEVELAYQVLQGQVVGITGSNGKSTTTQMAGAMLEAAGLAVEVCGNIGVPLSAKVEGPADRIFVTELSSFQLDSVDTFRPHAAALLNLSVDHLDWHGDEGRYFAAKTNLFRNQGPSDIAVLNADDERVAQVAVKARRRFFSSRSRVDDGCYLEGDIVVEVDPHGGRRRLFGRREVALPGPHNLENAMAAALLSLAVGADREAIAEAVNRFEGLPHRLQLVAELDGVLWFDDSKATNFAATRRSLEGFADGSVHLILGGRNKGGDPAELRQAVERKARRIYLVGEAAPEIGKALAGRVETVMAGTLRAAVTAARQAAVAGEAVLLSPACASFDQFENFAHRGRTFQTLVRSGDG